MLQSNLLVIDDDPDVLDMLRQLLAAEQYNVRLGIEIHAPHHFEEDWFKERLAAFLEKNR